MPYEIQPPVIFEKNMQEEPYKAPEDVIEEAYALALVRETYWQYETYRTLNHDRRWNTHDSLYVGYVPPRVWDGSNVARAAFTQPLVFDQVEAALPALSNAIFGIGAEWFQVQAEPGTDPQEALQIRDVLSYALEHPKDDLGSNAITELKLAFKQILLYGNGGVCIEWDPVTNRPSISWTDIRDLYFDPGACTPSVDEGSAVIRRKFMTIAEILELKKDPRMKIPEANVLYAMAKNVPQAPAEQTKRVQEALRGIYYSPGFSDYNPLPSDQKVEVLIYTSNKRIIWTLNQQWIAYNGPNPYGFINYAFAPCYIYPGRFYAQSIGDVQEQNQRYIEALLNAHYDELTLLLHPPRVQKRSTLITPAQQKWRPGLVINAENKDDVSLLQVGNNTVNVFDDIQYLTLTSEKRTGINAMGQGSVPQPSNANRTLGGLQMQSAGSSMRLNEIVENIENYLIVPLLYKLQKIIQFHTRPGQVLPASASSGQYYRVDATVIQKPLRFRMLASTRMITKDKLMQIFPFWMQAISTGNLLEQLQKTGKTVDFDELFRMLQDATGVGRLYNLVRPLSQQEQQAMQQPPPQVTADMQKAQLEAQTRSQIMDKKIQGDLQKEQIKKQPDYWSQQIEQQKAQQEMAQKQQEMQMDMQQKQQELQFQRLIKAMELQAKQQQHKMDLQKKVADVQIGQHKAQQDLQTSQLDHTLKMQQMMQMLGAERQQAAERQDIATTYPKGVQQTGEPVKGAEREERPKKKAEIKHKATPPK